MIKHILCITLLSLALTSCKKEKAPGPVPEPEAQGIFPNSPYTVSNATKFHGVFSLYKQTLFSNANYSNYVVSFNDTASANYYPGNLISVSRVKLNSNPINLDTTFHDYRAYDLFSGDNATETWQIQGANGIPSFNYTSYTDPKCTNYSTIPDSFNISTGVTFTLNITNVDAIGNHGIGLNDNSGHFTPEKPLHNGINVITFTSADFINFVTVGMGNIGMGLSNTEVLNFYGKDFQFVKRRTYEKLIKIKP
ncbi:MAG: hypothetical protein KAZ71_04715 [Bacteroidia bacterium]|nr:hypothetical protein [Bacteroidia bacterium]